MMRRPYAASIALLLAVGFASAELFQEITVGVPVSSITEAEAWYVTFLGTQVEVLKPFPVSDVSTRWTDLVARSPNILILKAMLAGGLSKEPKNFRKFLVKQGDFGP